MKNIDYKYDFEFLIDKITREALAVNIIKQKLEKHGFSVKISHQDAYTKPGSYDFFSKCKHKSKIIITPSFNVKRTKSIISKAIIQKSNIVVMHSEQLFPSIFDQEKLNVNDRELYNKVVEAHLCWGDFYKEKLIKFTKTNPEKIHITGNYKFEFVNPKSSLKDKPIERILAVSNFTLADLDCLGWEKFKDSHQIKNNQPLHEYYRAVRKQFIQSIRELCLNHPNINFKVRPHPGEEQSVYFEALKGFSNVIIDNSQEMSEDINKCNLVLMHTSSSIFECLLANKRVLSIREPILSTELMQTPTDIFEWYTIDEINNVIGKEEVKVSPKQLDILHTTFPMKGNVFDEIVLSLIEINETSTNYLKLDLSTFYIHISYISEAFCKDLFLKIGYVLKNIPVLNKINRFAIAHLKNRVRKQNFIPRRFTTKNFVFKQEVKNYIENK